MKNRKRNSGQRPKHTWAWALLLIPLIGLFTMSEKPIQTETPKVVAQEGLLTLPDGASSRSQDRYRHLMGHLAKNQVHRYLKPIHFIMNGRFAASGTMMLDKNGVPFQIVTANHLFSDTDPGSDYYDYAVVGAHGYTSTGHVSSVTLDSIPKGVLDPLGIHDVALANIGSPGLISRTSKVQVSGNFAIMGEFAVGKFPERKVVSLLTGEDQVIVGEAQNTAGNIFMVMLYECFPGESGGGYWSASEDRLYIVSGSAPVTERLRRDLSIPDNFTTVTLLSAIGATW